MTLPGFKHMRPLDVKEAVEILHENKGKARVIAGGSDLLVQLKQRTQAPEVVVDLKGIKGLDRIEQRGEQTVIGSLTTLDRLSRLDHIKERYPILSQAALKVGSAQIRNVGTLGGNICLNSRCWYYNQSAQWRKSIPRCHKMGGDQCLEIKNSDRCRAVFLADTVPALMVLDAAVKVVGKDGERTMGIGDLYTGKGERVNVLAPDEILTEIVLPKPPMKGYQGFYKDAPREVVDFAYANVALNVSFSDGTGICKEARIAVGGVSSGPVRSLEAEEMVKGEKITDGLTQAVADEVVKSCSPVSSIWVSAGQRRSMVRSFIRQGMKAAKEEGKR